MKESCSLGGNIATEALLVQTFLALQNKATFEGLLIHLKVLINCHF